MENDLAGAIHKTEAEGNSKRQDRGRGGDDDQGPGRRHGQLPDLQPGRLDQRHHRRGSSTSCSAAADSEPILDRATQGEYAPGSTWKVTTHRGRHRGRVLAVRQLRLPGSVNVGGHVFNNDFGNGGLMSLHQALVLSCDTIFYNFAYQIWQHDHRSADVVTSPHAPVQEMQKMELGWGFGKNHRCRPARAEPRHGADPRVAVLLLEGQRPPGPELVQVRPGQRQLRPADRVRRLPVRQRLGRRARRSSPRSARATCR